MMMKLGVDLGGTKIEAVVLNAQDEVLWRHRVPTPQSNYQATLTAIASLVTKAKTETGMSLSSAIGIATPGALTKTSASSQGVMKNCNSTVLNGKPLHRDLSEKLQCTVYLANDANCFALAETLSGQGRRLFKNHVPESVFGVILGTGVGGGVVIDGHILKGRHSIAGEWGHNALPAKVLNELPEAQKRRTCYCGRRDCIEMYLSGPGLALSYQLRFGETLSPQTIIAHLRDKDTKAQEIWQHYVEQLACSLSDVVNVLDPMMIVLGGGLSAIDEIYQSITTRMAPHVFSDNFNTPIVPALLGDSAGVYGAAWLSS